MAMTLKDIIRRRIFLKKQHIYLIGREIQALESDLHGPEGDPEPAREVGGVVSQAGAALVGGET